MSEDDKYTKHHLNGNPVWADSQYKHYTIYLGLCPWFEPMSETLKNI